LNTTRALLAGAVAAAIAAGPSGRAAEPRRAAREADLGEKRSVAPDASLGGSLSAPRAVQRTPGGPTLDFEVFRKQVEVEVSEKRREEIASMQKLIKIGGDSGETPGWYFRLAELLWEESQFYFFQANRRDDAVLALGKRGDPREVARLQGEKADLEKQSKRLQDQAVALYKAIVAKYPKYQRMDEVLFFLGENLTKRNRDDVDGLKAYRVLIKNFPQSRFVPDAWMAFGEHFFEKANKQDRIGNLKKALEAYRNAAADKTSNIYGFALYKQGWVHYNLAEWPEALDMFRAVILFGELPSSTVPQDKKLALVKEARKDYVRTYSHVGTAEAAVDDFRRIGGESGWYDMLRSLGKIYDDDGKDRDAVVSYARLIREKPLSPEAPAFQARIIMIAGRMGKKEAAVQQAHVFVKMLKEIEGAVGKDEKGLKQLADAKRDAENTLRILAVSYHNEWKKTRDEPVAGWAASVYDDYLEIFPGSPHAYEMRFFHGELLYALGDYEKAGAEYERVALMDAAASDAKPKAGEAPLKPGKYFQDALENTIFAYDEVAKKFDATDKKEASDPKKRTAIPPQRERLLKACQRYLQYQPQGAKWVETAYKAAQIYYRHNYFAEATDLFTRIALDHPKHELAEYSTNLVLDAYNLLGDWKNLNGWAKRFYGNRELVDAHGSLKDVLAKLIEESSFKVIEIDEKAGDHEKAADAYLAFAREWPASRLAPTAVYNASVDWVKAQRIDKAMEVREQFLQRFPSDVLAPKCIFDNAEGYETVADFAKAADFYERYFAEWRRSKGGAPAVPKKARGRKGREEEAPPAPAGVYEEKKANDAIINAAVFRAGLKDWARAMAASEAYLAAWPNGADASRLFLGLADIYSRQGQVAKELKQLEEYQRRYAKDPEEWLATQQRIAKLLEKAGNQRDARRAYELALDYYKPRRDKVKDRGLAPVAQAMYLDLEPAFAEYDRINFIVAPKLLKRQLEVKGQKLQKLQESYTAIVNLKQAEPAVCALYRIGMLYRRFSETFQSTPVPREIKANPEYLEEYKAQVASVTEPLEQKAVEGLELAVTKSRELGVRNDCARAATELLFKVKPEKYGPTLEAIPALAAPTAVDAVKGYGFVTAIQAVPAPRPARAARGEALPPLRSPGSGKGAARRVDEPGGTDESGRLPLPRSRKGGDDEDLLP
jgi:tetratricopeptide (TPR) repeat protein